MSPQQSKVHVYSKWFIYHNAIFRLYLSYPGNDLSCRTHPTHYIIPALYVCIACLCLFLMLVECFVCTITYTWSNTNYDCETKGNEKKYKNLQFDVKVFFFLFCLAFFLNDRWRWSLYFISYRLFLQSAFSRIFPSIQFLAVLSKK